MADGIAMRRSDIVAPRPVADTALGIAQRAAVTSPTSSFEPTPGGAFTHATTGIESTLGATTSFPSITTTMVTSDVAAAVVVLLGEVVSNRKLLNRVVYTLEANGMTS